MQNCSNSSQFTSAFPVCIASSAVMVLCFLLGVIGNVAVLRTLIQRLKENNFTIRMMLSLAISDLLNLLPLPVWIWALLHGWTFGSAACKITFYIIIWMTSCSTLCVTLMSVQRFMQVLHPQKWSRLGTKGENGLLWGIWILSGVLASFVPVQYDVGCELYGFQFCYQHFTDDADKVVTTILEITKFMVFFNLLFYFYYRLHRGVNESPFFSSNRMTKLVTRIVSLNFIFNILVPTFDIVFITAVFLNNDILQETAELYTIMAKSLAFLNNCVNPFLYTFAFRQNH
ncbi:leukotriene B4 receptor 1-like [Hoplias malabaricus]|uniref:leukotriene B4 receptor 1-like n=1 Tax=Hoplias malabaricus TaxID=27720 RepID=UPI003462A12C